MTILTALPALGTFLASDRSTSVAAQPIGALSVPQPDGPPPTPPAGHVIELSGETADTRQVLIPLGTVDLGELTPIAGTPWKRGELTIFVTSAFGYFPRYKIMARSLTLPGGPPGALTTADIGLGVVEVIARAPKVAPDYDYDPSTVPKNIDDEPIFLGTIESLGVLPPGAELFRSRGFYFGNWNQFTLAFAVGPQFYTQEPPLLVQIELELILL